MKSASEALLDVIRSPGFHKANRKLHTSLGQTKHHDDKLINA